MDNTLGRGISNSRKYAVLWYMDQSIWLCSIRWRKHRAKATHRIQFQPDRNEYQCYENQHLCHRDRTYQELRPASKKTQSSSHPNTKDMEKEQHNLYEEDQTRLLPQLLAPALNAVKGQKEELIRANSWTREEKLPL